MKENKNVIASRRRGNLIKVIILLILITFPALAAEEKHPIINQVYSIVHNHYIEPITYDKFAMLSLKSLSEIDKEIMIADDSKRISIYHKSVLIKSIPKPKKDDSASWANFTRRAIKETQKVSKELKSRDFEITDVMFTNAFNNLDSGSKYHTSFEIEEENEEKPISRSVKDDVLYIKIKELNKNTKNIIKDSIKPYTQALILDLRGNKGGILADGIDVAMLFLDGGIVTSVKTPNEATKYYTSNEGDILDGKPLVVLVDGNTASSAEVLAAALQDNSRAHIIGTNTFGKGTVQTLYSLDDGSTLALSTSYFYTPEDKEINKVGIMPNYCTSDVIELNTKTQCPKENRESRQEDIETTLDFLRDKI